ncbi:MAG: RDD family protein [Actinobacteria bacterium]|nr:RDD family protein [Actinomycetota bacterium]
MSENDAQSGTPNQPTPNDAAWRGARLALPANGVGSIAGFGQRVLALSLDWALSSVLTLLLGARYASPSYNLTVFILTAVLMWLAVTVTGASLGQHAVGIAVARLSGGRLPLLHALVRTALLMLVFPAVITDSDGRGLHDKAVGSVVIKSR